MMTVDRLFRFIYFSISCCSFFSLVVQMARRCRSEREGGGGAVKV